MNRLGIDVVTEDQSALISALSDQPEVMSAVSGGTYRMDASYCQVIVETSWTEAELEDWLYSYSAAHYVGVFHA
jgi:hypothetical protein